MPAKLVILSVCIDDNVEQSSRAEVVASASPGKAKALVVATPLVLCNDSSTAVRRLDRSRRVEDESLLARNFLTMAAAAAAPALRMSPAAFFYSCSDIFPRLNI